jgi:dTDP-4-amino-4,6-dideoxygalactose transaminase
VDAAAIEDAAQANGAEYPGTNGVRQAGTMSGAGCFSFYPSKNLGAAEPVLPPVVCQKVACRRKILSTP